VLKKQGKKMKHILGHLISKCVHFSLQIGIGHPGRPFPGQVNYRKRNRRAAGQIQVANKREEKLTKTYAKMNETELKKMKIV
jgi:hypothetical protein